jgi:hypothetical protein
LDVEQTLEPSAQRAAAVAIWLTRRDDGLDNERAIIRTVMKATTITKFVHGGNPAHLFVLDHVDANGHHQPAKTAAETTRRFSVSRVVVTLESPVVDPDVPSPPPPSPATSAAGMTMDPSFS